MLTRIVKQAGLILVLPIFFLAALFALFQQSVKANVLTVTNTNDSGPGSLRQAIADAVDGDLIAFDATLSGQVITLTSGELFIDKVLTIDASNLAERPTINGNDNSRLFYITATGVITINYLALTQGHALSGIGACPEDCGGAIFIYTDGVAHIQNTHIFSNTSYGHGGSVANFGDLTLNNAVLSGNHSGSRGGSIYNDQGNVQLFNSTLSNNSAWGSGGAIESNYGNVQLFDIILSNNSAAAAGGAIYALYGELTIENSIISSNDSGFGGGIYAGGNNLLSIISSSISNNIAHQGTQGQGGGVNLIATGTSVISDTVISGNSALDRGGGMHIFGYGGFITITSSTISSNSTANDGGGVYNHGGIFFLKDVTISNNHANDSGGGLATYLGVSKIMQSTIYDNSSDDAGGGIYAHNSILDMSNSTVSGNSASFMGGIYHTFQILTITNSTIANNSPEGVMSLNSATFHLSNSIIAYHDGYDCAAYNQQTNINNLIEDGTCSPALTGDPLLAPLADNGGETYTHALLPASPAVDAGDDTVCSSEPVNNQDQRGITRPLDGDNDGEFHCDIGAFEAEGAFLSIAKSGPALAITNTSITYELEISNLSQVTMTNVIITDALPVGANYVSGGTLVGNVVSWTVPNLLPGGVITEQFVVTATETITNQHYRVSSNEGYIAQGYVVVVTQVETPISGLTAVNNSPATLGHTTTFTATIAIGSNATYTWDFGDGTTGIGPIVSHTYTEAGNYTAIVTARNAVSEVSAETAVTIIASSQTMHYIYLPVVIRGSISP